MERNSMSSWVEDILIGEKVQMGEFGRRLGQGQGIFVGGLSVVTAAASPPSYL